MERKLNLGGKSSLKKELDDKDTDDEKGKKRSVTFGKSVTYEVTGGESESGDLDFKATKPKKVIAEKDLSDGRNEKEKLKEEL